MWRRDSISTFRSSSDTLTCVEHAPKEVDQSIRPVEESLLNSSTDQPVNNEDPLLRDYSNSFEELEEVGSSDSPSDKL